MSKQTRRTLPRDAISEAIRVAKSRDPFRTCRRTIRLDGTLYRCGREVRRIDGQHDGIHDAFETHGDTGCVRW